MIAKADRVQEVIASLPDSDSVSENIPEPGDNWEC
jgi:hypothetical protein